MVIDFHTHTFPDAMAAKTIAGLEAAGNVKAYTDGTVSGLKASMREAGIDLSVILPVVTKPKQFHTINTVAAEITGRDGILSFGGIHPDSEDYKGELRTIKELGLKGIKLHPDYQKTFIDDERYVRILDYAAELSLIAVIHAGLDIGLPDPVHCPPDRAANLLKQLDTANTKIVFAHVGGYDRWDAVEEYLVGKNIWFDISYSLHKIGEEQFLRIVNNHGTDKILFATDSPWGGQKETLERFQKLPLSQEKKERILYKNAMQLLEIQE
ncbi:MAG: amidohydrolase family protein [Lachnospiraceae bacterium]|nr:amidohydrolase family protein [Lachnospiraceae bacterium]